MPLDPVATAGLVSREVRTGSREGAPTRIVVARRDYSTDREDLWDAVTNGERIARWFLPISGDLAPGGRFQLEGNAGGTIERCEAPGHLAVTWEYGGHVSWVEVSLAATPAGTTLELAHEASVDPDFWDRFGPGAVGIGWDLGLMGLGLHVDEAPAFDPRSADDWATTPEGTAFVRSAAAGWADAAAADGDEPEQAHEAADRTVAFYTVPPDAAGEG